MKIKTSPELTEICGIHAGDGYLRGKDHRKELDISGNIEEKEYYDKHVKSLFKKVFNIIIEPRYFESRNTYGFVLRNLEIIKFLKSLGFPYGKKTFTVKIPKFILKSKDKKYIFAFLRGLFDTDGCVHFWNRKGRKYSLFKRTHNYYPLIAFSTVSEPLFKDVKIVLKKIGLNHFGSYNSKPRKKNEAEKYTIRFYGQENVKLFFKKVNPKNPVKVSRFLLWKKMGFCPSKTTYSQRLKMLKTNKEYGLISQPG